MKPLFLAVALAGCAANNAVGPPPPSPARDTAAFLDTLQERTFHYFWDLTNPQNGLTPDRAPSPSFSSIAAGGFALTGHAVGAELGLLTRTPRAAPTLPALRSVLSPL